MAAVYPIGRKIAQATALAGLLDIAAAALLAAKDGHSPARMLRGLASGPFPDALHWGFAGAAAGLAVHFAIMAVMAGVFMLAWQRIAFVRAWPLSCGAVYGLVLWGVMYGAVLPARWPSLFHARALSDVATQLFCHVALVGLPMGLVARRG
jgi:hypothetical protein